MRPGVFFLLVSLVTSTVTFLPGTGRSGELVIVGTGAGMPVLRAVGKAFTLENPGTDIIIPPSIGSGGGIRAVGRDEHILGRVARDVGDREKKYGLTQHPLAKLPIVFYVNANVSLVNIEPYQACSIYGGLTRNWADFGAGNGLIRVIRREEDDSSLKILLENLPGFRDITPTRVSKVTYTDQETVEACLQAKNSIAYGTLSNVIHIPEIRVLKLSNVHPSSGEYALFGPLNLVYKEKNRSGILKAFLDFVSSEAARTAIIDAGGVTLQ